MAGKAVRKSSSLKPCADFVTIPAAAKFERLESVLGRSAWPRLGSLSNLKKNPFQNSGLFYYGLRAEAEMREVL